MPEITFNKATGKLKAFGKTWNAKSGTSTIAGLDSKPYVIPRNALMAGKTGLGVPANAKYNVPSYTDKKGLSWFIWLGVGNLGIHPDGGPPGTLGCIGITDSDTKLLFNDFKSHYGSSLNVVVS